jgi:4-diphosphocytidyl-2-C-methyl-D-erythritol kinase
MPAFAKINLALEVLAKRPDGYHDLDSILVAIDWHDLISLEVKPADRTEVKLFLRGPRCGEVPQDGRNLAVRAAHELATLSAKRWNIEIAIDKRVPVGAGLGGGSSDAATVIKGVLQLFARHGVEVDRQQMAHTALQLGSDIPALISPGAVRVQGRGEVTGCFVSPNLNLVVVATVPNSTADVFAAVKSFSDGSRVKRLAELLERGGELPDDCLGSDLEGPAEQTNPRFADALTKLRGEFHGQNWQVTGSGGGAFALLPNRAAALSLAEQLTVGGWDSRACRVVSETG